MRTLVAAAVACSILVSLSQAQTSEASIKKPVNIAAQGLSSALQEFAQERELYLIYAQADVEHARTSGASGELTQDKALRALLEGTGLTYRYLDEKTVTIVPVATAPAIKPDGIREEEKGAQKKSGFWGRFRVAEADVAAPEVKDEKREELSEIVVTAQKREERLQDVPISISVLGGDDLDRSTVQGVSEALARVPGVSIFQNPQGGGSFVTVRGVAASRPIFAGSSPVSYYLDSLPFGLIQTAIAPDADAYDLDRVEVLRGPQGTLYGAGGAGGVVRVLTHDADLDRFELKARASGSATQYAGGNYRGDMAVNAPLVAGKLGARAVISYQDLSGWIDTPVKNNSNDAQLRSARLKIGAQPTEQLSISAFAWLSRQDYGGLSTGDENRLRAGITSDESSNADYDAYGVTLSYEFPGVRLTSMTSYLDYNSGGLVENPGLIIDTKFDASVFSQELNLSSSGEGAWRWTAGAMFRDAEDTTYQALPVVPLELGWKNTSSSYAVFGEVSRELLNDQWALTLGARYFHDDVTTEALPIVGLPPPGYRVEDTFTSTTPRVVLTWHPQNDLTMYGSYSEGFRSGTPQPYYITGGVVGGLPSVKPDTLRNYEVGAKGRFMDGRIEVEGAVFYLEWKDVQQNIAVLFRGQDVSAFVNAPSASGVGMDIGITTHPTDRLSLSLAGSWNDLTSDTDVLSGNVVLFSKGDRLNYSPEYTANASLEYEFPLPGTAWESRIWASVNYTSEQSERSTTAVQAVAAFGDDQVVGRAGFGIRTAAHWDVSLFVDNVTNENPAVYRSPFFGTERDARIRPRTVGLQFDYRL